MPKKPKRGTVPLYVARVHTGVVGACLYGHMLRGRGVVPFSLCKDLSLTNYLYSTNLIRKVIFFSRKTKGVIPFCPKK